MPRPLNERIGLTHSTFNTVVTPSRSLIGSQTNCGESRNTGSITPAASSIRCTEIVVSTERESSRAQTEDAAPGVVRAAPYASRSRRAAGLSL